MATACAWTITLLYIYFYVWGLDLRLNNINFHQSLLSVNYHILILNLWNIIQLKYYNQWVSYLWYVQQFYKSYITCMWSKPQHHKPYGSLKQLIIPEQLWNSISMDFIEKFLSFSGFDTILFIVNWLTKQAIFIPAYDTIMSVDLAYLFVLHVFFKHGVSSHVISNRGSEFVSNFFWSLGTALDIWLHFTSGYHPEGDRQTEHMN